MSDLIELGDVGKFINGRAFKPSDWADSGLPIIRIQNLTGSTNIWNRFQGKVDNRNLVIEGDILISWSASLGVYRWKGENAVLNQHIFKVVLNEEIDDKYFFYAASNALLEMKGRVHGSTMQHITKDEFDSLRILVPSLPEQQRIAAMLERADHLRRTRRFARQTSDSFLQSVFLKMFGDPVSNPMGWNVVVLEEHLSKIESGWSPVCGETRSTDNEWAVLKLSAVTGGKYIPNENKQLLPETVTRPKLEVKKGDVLFTRKNTEALVAACAYVFQTPPRLLLPDTVFRFAFKNESQIAPIYLWAMLTNKDFKRRVQMLATGSAGSMPNISKEKLLELKIPLPPIEKQREFAAIVRRFERFRAGQIEAERQVNHLFETLLHRAFSTN